MSAEFGSSPIVRVEAPNKGYQATITFLLDSHQITAYMVPAFGRSSDGGSASGYYFTAAHSGTMPLSGMSRANRLRDRLAQGAAAISPSVPQVMP